MKKYVYLAGPIEGCSNHEINQWRQKCYLGFNENLIGVNPYRAETHSDDPEARKRIMMKNYMDTKSCDLILAYMPRELNQRRPSYGTTIEIGWAIGLKKPIILVTDDEYLTEHPLIRANVNWVFEDFQNAIDVIHGLFDDYVGNG